MHQFWNTIKKIGKTDAYDFKLDKKKCRVETEELGYSGNCEMLSAIRTDQMHQPWRTFVAVINRCISRKSTGLARIGESRAQVLWGMNNQKNVDYVALLWEDFMYQADNREISSARKEHMPYPRFTKVIVDHFISKDNTISMRNIINLHTARDDSLLGALKFVSKTEDCQKYGALIPDGMINDDIKQSQAYKTYLNYATRKVPLKKARKFKKHASPKLKTVPASPKEPTQKDTPGKSVLKKKAPARTDRDKGIKLLSDVALLEEAQLKKTLRKSKRETHKLQASGSSEGADFESEVPDEQTDKTKDTSEGTGVELGEDENDDFNDEDDDGGNDDDSGNDDDGDYEEEEQDEEYVHTPEKDKSDDEEKMYEEEDDDVTKELYGDLNITQGLRDTDMTNAEQGGEDQQNASQESGFVQEEDDGHVMLATVHDKTNGIVDQYLASKMKEAVDVAVWLQSNKLKEEAEAEN
ncbi:hypothetical protein Tco_1492376 [Tanacetum coccineum]